MKNFNYTVTKYKGMKYPKTGETILLKEVLKTIKEGDENLPLIIEAREHGKESIKYDYIKSNKLPTVRFNFLFNGNASNKNISTSTGLIYIDIDNTNTIPHSNYVFAKWKSLSNKGFGILVKIKHLTEVNYKDAYNKLSTIIGIESDSGARKATQQTVLSYDNNLYYNPSSATYIYREEKKVSNSTIIKKKEEGIGLHDTFYPKNESSSIRFNNINDYFYDNTPYIVFNEKVNICNPFIPREISEGKRNSVLFFLLSQYALLNINQGRNFLISIGRTILNKMQPKLSEKELYTTVDNVLEARENKSFKIYFNEERRILFNPKLKLSFKEKMKIVNTENASLKIEKTRKSIYLTLENWDFQIDGKLIQANVAKKANLSIITIKRHWKYFKDYLDFLKN